MQQKTELLDETIEDQLKQIAKVSAEETIQNMPETALAFENIKQKQERLETEFFENLKAFRKEMQKGVWALIFECENVLKNVPKIEAEKIRVDVNKISGNFPVEIDENVKTQLKDHLEMANASMEILYQAAKNLFDKGFLEEAESAFFLLTLLDSENFAFWMGYGACAHVRGLYEQALLGYATAASCDPSDPMCHIWAADCYKAQGDMDLAKNSLERALVAIEGAEDQEPLRLFINGEIKNYNI